MKMFLVFCWLLTIYSCSSKQITKDEQLEIVVEDAQSYKYDLAKGKYTVYMRQGDTTVRFTLTGGERKRIVDQYYELGLDAIPGKYGIEDNCEMMPKLLTVLKVKSNLQSQEITIDDDCKNYKGLFDMKGKRVSVFLRFVREMLHKKIEIKQAPKSDIMYL